MKRKVLLLPALAVIALALTATAHASGNANLILGSRSMSDNAWSDNGLSLDSQSVWGVDVDFTVSDWPVSIEAGYQHSSKSDSGLDAKIDEWFVGANKSWHTKTGGGMHPFAGGGIASVDGKIEGAGGDVKDSSGGFYVHGGIYWKLAKSVNIGFDGRVMLGTKLTISGVDTDANYSQLAFLIGYGWPKSK